MEKPVRLDKFLADAGAGTRSEVKKYIQKGQVQVNGKSVKKPELKVTEEDQVVMNGQELHAAPEYVYYLFNKPAGCVSATEDFRDKTVLDYIEEKDRRKGLFPVGRLDKDTEGFLLITDDGPLAHELLSPKKHVDKTYYAKVSGKVTEEDVVKLAEGVDIGEKISHDRQGWRSFLPGSPAQNLQKPVRTGNLRSDLPSTRENSIR